MPFAANDYLTFAREMFARECESLVVLGHGLRSPDSNIRRLIAKGCRDLAVSARPGSMTQVIQRKARIANLFPKKRIEFFDATSHPLDDPALRIGPLGKVSKETLPKE